MKVTPLILGTTMRSCGKQFRDRSRGKNCDESFKIFDFCDFEISIFRILIFAFCCDGSAASWGRQGHDIHKKFV
jgi:hypothetical protein